MAKFIFLLCGVFLLCTFLDEATASGDCPLASKVASCSPKCLQDSECTYGKKCCANLCNSKSCAEPTNANSKYGSSSGGSYCNNVKCNSFEKCQLDRATNKMKCVRA